MNMKNKFWAIALAAAAVSTASCKKEMIKYNTNPGTLYTLEPEEQFTNGCIAVHDADFEYYYDYYRIMMPWLQYHTTMNGNGKTFMSEVGNFNQRRGYFYTRVGNVLTDVMKQIEAKPASEQPKYAHEKAMAVILRAYYALYTTDINGSIPYTEAFMARYTGNLTPTYDVQQAVFETVDKELKDAIATLKSASVAQANYGNADLYYKGDAKKWVKAANALRVRLAMRWIKRDPNKARAIAQEALAIPADIFEGNMDNLQFVTSASHAGANSNWDPSTANFRAPKAMVDFMWDTDDPRLSIFFQENSYSQAYFDSAKIQGKLPASAVYNRRRFVGSFASPDAAAAPQNAKYYTTRRIKVDGANVDLDTLSKIQYRLFCPAVGGGEGKLTFPMLTYAELCFYRAELAVRGLVGSPAQVEEFYNRGIIASVAQYNTMALNADVQNVMPGDLFDYMLSPKVKYDPARGLEMIAVQQYIHFFKQANEGWNVFKRTGFPNATSTVLPWERVMADGVEQIMPRRALITLPVSTDLNYNNAKAALDDMQKDPDFGQGGTDIYGRVWWDKK